jgi:predicted Zn finger-like uncharacterized protein
MSLITECPGCKTLFRVDAIVLMPSEGWGRCGQCQNVFEAKPYVLPIQMPALDLNASPLLEAYTGHEPAPPKKIRATIWTRVLQGPLWHTMGWSLIGLLLLALLGLQSALFDRDRWAAKRPELKAALHIMCQYLMCDIKPYRDAEAVVIEASSLSKTPEGEYRFTLGLRNAAAYEVASPALELTLTDALDQVMVRKVLKPQELGWTSDRLMPYDTVQLDATIHHQPTNPGQSVAGYRVLAFYP